MVSNLPPNRYIPTNNGDTTQKLNEFNSRSQREIENKVKATEAQLNSTLSGIPEPKFVTLNPITVATPTKPKSTEKSAMELLKDDINEIFTTRQNISKEEKDAIIKDYNALQKLNEDFNNRERPNIYGSNSKKLDKILKQHDKDIEEYTTEQKRLIESLMEKMYEAKSKPIIRLKPETDFGVPLTQRPSIQEEIAKARAEVIKALGPNPTPEQIAKIDASMRNNLMPSLNRVEQSSIASFNATTQYISDSAKKNLYPQLEDINTSVQENLMLKLNGIKKSVQSNLMPQITRIKESADKNIFHKIPNIETIISKVLNFIRR